MRKIVCLICLVGIAACSPQQVVLEREVIVTVRDTVFVPAPVPPTSTVYDVVVDWFDGLVDSFYLEDSTSFAIVRMENDTTAKKRKYRVTHGRKADTVYIKFPVVITDTILIQQDCPPTLPAMPENGKFPWALVLTTMGALLVFFVARKKKGES